MRQSIINKLLPKSQFITKDKWYYQWWKDEKFDNES